VEYSRKLANDGRKKGAEQEERKTEGEKRCWSTIGAAERARSPLRRVLGPLESMRYRAAFIAREDTADSRARRDFAPSILDPSRESPRSAADLISRGSARDRRR